MKSLPYILALLLLASLFWAVHEGGRATDMEAALRDAKHSRDVALARLAEATVEAERARPDERRAWTVLVVFAALAGFLVGRFG